MRPSHQPRRQLLKSFFGWLLLTAAILSGTTQPVQAYDPWCGPQSTYDSIGQVVAVMNGAITALDNIRKASTDPVEIQNCDDSITVIQEARGELLAYLEKYTGECPPAQPTQGQPTQGQPTQYQPTQYQPTQYQPTQSQPTQSQPTQSQPTQGQPTQSQPTQNQPTQYQPTQSQPTQYEPTQGQPTQ